ncbi:hypothetical protein, partial [Erwinia billingiae]
MENAKQSFQDVLEFV